MPMATPMRYFRLDETAGENVRHGLPSILFLMAGLVAGACGASQQGATPRALSAARSRAPEGARIYDQQCASCHGERGEGLSSSPSVMGPTALPVVAAATSAGDSTRPAFRSAEDLFAYVSAWMPRPSERIVSLSPEEYWAVVNYLLIATGAPVPASGVNAGNASTIPVH